MSYVRCINCSYNNVAKGIRLLNKKHFLFITENFMQGRAFERLYLLKKEEESLNHHETPGRQIKQSNQLSLHHQDNCNARMDIK